MAKEKDQNDGDPVRDQACPRCRKLGTVVYSGNYWCTACPWAMSENGSPDRIIVAYLLQRRAKAVETNDAETVAQMDFYLKDYDGFVL